jgi:hypothetical protein
MIHAGSNVRYKTDAAVQNSIAFAANVLPPTVAIGNTPPWSVRTIDAHVARSVSSISCAGWPRGYDCPGRDERYARCVHRAEFRTSLAMFDAGPITVLGVVSSAGFEGFWDEILQNSLAPGSPDGRSILHILSLSMLAKAEPLRLEFLISMLPESLDASRKPMGTERTGSSPSRRISRQTAWARRIWEILTRRPSKHDGRSVNCHARLNGVCE